MIIATLSDCSKCAKLKSELNCFRREYKECDCNKFPDLCDTLEEITNTLSYPMVIVNNSRKQEFHYVCDTYENFKSLNAEINNYILKPYASLELMIEKLKSIK